MRIKNFFLSIFNFFVFSSLYIALCAVIMVHQTNHLLGLPRDQHQYMLFVFFASICSYNFHWYLSPHARSEKIRERWMARHRHYNLYFFLVGLVGVSILAFQFFDHWWALLIAAGLTFLYSAPKIPHPLFAWLKKVAIGKTLYLSFVWMYVTTLLPIIVNGKSWQTADLLFCLSRFLLIYAICIIFDYRDREGDRKDGIRSMVTYFDEMQINRLFYITLLGFLLSTLLLLWQGFSALIVITLIVPGVITLVLFRESKRNFSDYLYYFVLDGLMMFSALLTWFMAI